VEFSCAARGVQLRGESAGDINGDGTSDATDLSILLGAWS
jgi:hypothetical protein